MTATLGATKTVPAVKTNTNETMDTTDIYKLGNTKNSRTVHMTEEWDGWGEWADEIKYIPNEQNLHPISKGNKECSRAQ